MADASWTAADVAKHLCDALVASGKLRANPGFIREDREAVRRELEYKLDPSLRSGGCVFSLDHRIPNGISIENYRYYFALPPLDPSRTGWCSHGDVINCTYTVINVWRYSQTRCSVHM